MISAVSTNIVDGKKLASQLLTKLSRRLKQLPRPLRFQAVIVANNPASEIYLKEKARTAKELGVEFRLQRYSAGVSARQLRRALYKLRQDFKPDGMLIQLPLPAGLPSQYILNSIPPGLDVDVLSSRSLGGLCTGRLTILPPTTAAILHILEREKVNLSGAEVVIVGRGRLVGRPLMIVMIARGATVTVCHSQTKDVARHTRRAEVVVSATGRPDFLTREMIAPGAVVIDAGSGLADADSGKGERGDVKLKRLMGKAKSIAPVPGGIGPLSVVYLFQNLYQLWRKSQ